MEPIAERKSLKETVFGRFGAILFAGSLALAACGGDNETGQPVAREDTTTSTSSEFFRITREWSLPPRAELSPRIMTPELCEQHWTDEDGTRQPAVQEEPLIVRVDGRCNTPLDVEENGVYFSPIQRGRAPIKVVNGDALGVECYITGESIQDIRGPRTSSDVWLGVVTARGEQGFFPETNAGYVDETKLRPCP